MARTKAPEVVSPPLVLIMGMVPEGGDLSFIGGIKNCLPNYGLPGVATCFSDREKFRSRLKSMVRQYPSIQLILLSLRDIDKPSELISIVREQGLKIVVIAPLKRHGKDKSFDFSALGVSGSYEGSGNYVEAAAFNARHQLNVTTPCERKNGSGRFIGGGIAVLPRNPNTEFMMGDDPSGEELDEFSVTDSNNPSASDLAEGISDTPRQETVHRKRGRPPGSGKGTSIPSSFDYAPRPVAIPTGQILLPAPELPSNHPQPIRPPATTQTKKEIAMSTQDFAILDLDTFRADCGKFLEGLQAIVAKSQANLKITAANHEAVLQVVARVNEGSQELLAEINSRPTRRKSAKKAMAKTKVPRRRATKEDSGFKPRKGREEIQLAGRSIALSSGPAQVMKLLLKKQGSTVPIDTLLNGSSRAALDQRLLVIRYELSKTFGKNGPAIVNHPREGWSLDLPAG